MGSSVSPDHPWNSPVQLLPSHASSLVKPTPYPVHSYSRHICNKPEYTHDAHVTTQ